MRVILLSLLTVIPMYADFGTYKSIPVDPAMQGEVEQIAQQTLREFAASKLIDGHLSISLIDMTDPSNPRRAAYREEITYHPASVVKAFYLVMVHEQLSRGRLAPSEELDRAVRDMIVDSGNDATSYVVDAISGVGSGPELPPRAFRKFQAKRNIANHYFHSRGYDINANGKTWCENVYGREKQLLGPNREYRNRMTSGAAASLMYGIINRKFVSPAATDKMLALMKRPLIGETESDDGQVTEFTGAALPAGSKLWSKAGWTGEVRHDMAYIELPNGKKYVIAICTRGASADVTLIPAISAKIVKLMSR